MEIEVMLARYIKQVFLEEVIIEVDLEEIENKI